MPTIPAATLATGASIVCTGSHTITQGDLDAGSFLDTGNATSTETNAPPTPDTVNATQTTTLGLTKADNLNPAKYDHVGQVVSYTLTAKNNGNVTLHNVSVSDRQAIRRNTSTGTIPDATLAPGESIVCTGSHTITQGDLDAGSFLDTGNATSTETNAPSTPDTVTVTQTSTLSLHDALQIYPAKYDHVGQVVCYTLTAKNNVNVTLHNASV